MSGCHSGIKSLSGFHSSNGSWNELTEAFTGLLKQGLHGIAFSPYLEGQTPGDPVCDAQIRNRLKIIKPHTTWIRAFSCTDGNERVPGIAKSHGFKTMVGAWLEDDADKNERELECLIHLGRLGWADIVAVGNEVLYRKEMSLDSLIATIRRVKAALPDCRVGYADAYYEFCDHPELTRACDVILANCYPFWEGCHADYALPYLKDMYWRVRSAAGSKPVVISETGWPSAGERFGDSEPSAANALRYFVNTQRWALEDNIDIIYFSSFDESWKTEDEGDVGACWGLWDAQGKLKYVNGY